MYLSPRCAVNRTQHSFLSEWHKTSPGVCVNDVIVRPVWHMGTWLLAALHALCLVDILYGVETKLILSWWTINGHFEEFWFAYGWGRWLKARAVTVHTQNQLFKLIATASLHTKHYFLFGPPFSTFEQFFPLGQYWCKKKLKHHNVFVLIMESGKKIYVYCSFLMWRVWIFLSGFVDQQPKRAMLFSTSICQIALFAALEILQHSLHPFSKWYYSVGDK